MVWQEEHKNHQTKQKSIWVEAAVTAAVTEEG